ncbi:RidA family protein [Terrarubrum flagellatum]|uniref:RidA family protein n=1 Tax=Terrirubrum flagellatum TaxID=2895980 RepID=UPI003144E1E8
MSAVEDNLAREGVILPTPAAAVANYVAAVITGQLLVISGQLAFGPGMKIADAHKGKLGESVSIEDGQAAARACAINVLAQAKAALGGDLDRIKRCVRLGGFINALPDFNSLPQVMNGASDLMVMALGEAGRHARTTVGVAQLPMDCAVEVEAMFEIVR